MADTAFRHAPESALRAEAASTAWWASFGDGALSRLVERAAASNHDVRIEVERARQARAGETATASRLWPSLDLAASASDSRSGMPESVKQRLPDTRAARAGVSVGWELDVFGGARAAADAAGRETQAASFGVAGAQLLAVSEVARQYFIRQGARERLRIVEALAQTQRDTERLTRSREGAGLASRFDVARASAEATNLEAQLPPLRTLVSVTETRIAVLLGASPSSLPAELSQTAAPALPEVPEIAAG